MAGSYILTADITEYLNEDMFDEDDGLLAYIEWTPLKVDVVFTFREDGTVKATIGEDSIDKLGDYFRSLLNPVMEEYLVDTFAASGIDLDVDALLANVGAGSMEDFVDMVVETTLPEMEESIHSSGFSGYWGIRSGKLYLGDIPADEMEPEQGESYTLEDGKLTLFDSPLDAVFGTDSNGENLVLIRQD